MDKKNWIRKNFRDKRTIWKAGAKFLSKKKEQGQLFFGVVLTFLWPCSKSDFHLSSRLSHPLIFVSSKRTFLTSRKRKLRCRQNDCYSVDKKNVSNVDKKDVNNDNKTDVNFWEVNVVAKHHLVEHLVRCIVFSKYFCWLAQTSISTLKI